MAVALTPIWAEPRRGGRAEYVALIVACYVLAFTTFENLGTLGESGRAVPEEVRFDAIAAIKACARVGAAALVAWVLARRAGGARFGAVLGRLWPLVLFAVWGAFTALWSPMPALTLGHALEFLLLLLIAVAAALVCDRPGRSERLLFHICLIQVAYLALLVILALADPASARLVRVRLETEQILFAAEAETTFVKNPAEIACIASLAVILALAARLVWGWRWTRALLWPALGLGGGLLVVTQSRAPIAVSVALCGLTLVFWGGRRRVAAAGLLLCLALAVYTAVDPGLERAAAAMDTLAGYLSRGQSSEELRGLGGRLTNWTGVFGALDEHPGAIFTGFGYSMASPTGRMLNDGVLRRYTGHNILLDVVAGTGVPGTLLFIVGFAGLFIAAARGLAGPGRRVSFLMLLMLLYAFLSGVFGDSIVGPMDPTSVAVFALVGMGLLTECGMRNAECGIKDRGLGNAGVASIPHSSSPHSALRTPRLDIPHSAFHIPHSVLLLQETLPFHGGVPRKFLGLARSLPSGAYHFGCLHGGGESILPRIAATGAPVVNFGSKRPWLLIPRLRGYLRRHRIRAVLAYSFRAYGVAKAAALFTGCKVAFGACDFALARKPLRFGLFKMLSRRDWVVANSRALLAAYAAPGTTRAVLLPNGVEPPPHVERAAARKELGLPPEATVVLYAADCLPIKDHATLLAAFAQLAPRWPELWLVLCGRNQGKLPRQIAALEPAVRARVRHFGPRDDIQLFYAAADLYAHPCYDEGFGVAVAEAMAAGLPVVAAAAGGLPETVGTAGVLFEPRNPAALAAALDDLLRRPARRAELGILARERIRGRHDPVVFPGNFAGIMTRILEEP